MKCIKETHEQMIVIIKDYLEGDLSYAEVTEKHNISYNNVYSWVQKPNESFQLTS